MQMNFKVPFYFRAKPKACKNVRDILVSQDVAVDVPEIDAHETVVTFETTTRGIFDLRNYRGDTYRKIADNVKLNPIAAWASIQNPFYADFGRHRNNYASRQPVIPPWGGCIPERLRETGTMMVGPIAHTLFEEMTWLMDRADKECNASRTAWPTKGAGEGDHHSYRSHHDFNKVISDVTDIDWESVDLSNQMVATETQKFVIFSGELWMKTRQPCIMVDRVWSWKERNDVTISMVTAPEAYVNKPECMFFSLDDIDEALSYARVLAEGQEASTENRLPQFDCSDAELLKYDWRTEAVNRFGYTAAVEVKNFLERQPGYTLRIPQDRREKVQEAYEETLTTNYILGRQADMGRYVNALVDAWSAISYKQKLDAGTTYRHSVEYLANRVSGYAEEAPVEIGKQSLKLRLNS